MIGIAISYYTFGLLSGTPYTLTAKAELQGAAKFNDAAVKSTVDKAAKALAARLPTGGAVKSYTIANLDANGKVVPTESVTENVNYAGEVVMASDAVIAPAYHVIEYDKNAVGGSAGSFQIRGLLTTSEVEEWDSSKIIPDRFEPTPPTVPTVANSLAFALNDALNNAIIKLHLPDRRDGNGAIVKRPVTSVKFAGLVKRDATKVTKSSDAKEVSAKQAKINEAGAAARRALKKDENGIIPQFNIVLAQAARAEAVLHLNALTPVLRVRIKWPAVFNDPILGNLPQLPQP